MARARLRGGDRFHGRAADAHLAIFGDAARPHVAVLAADARLAVADRAGFEIRARD